MSEIVLPAATQFVAVDEIAGLIARALHPEPVNSDLTVSYFIKTARQSATGETKKWNGWPIDADDRKALEEIWIGLPPLPESATALQIRPYLDAFQEKGQELDWELGICWNNPALNAAMLRADAEEQHQKEVVSAINKGGLEASFQSTRLPCKSYFPNLQVSIDELARYVGKFQITLHLAVSVEALPGIYEKQEAEKRFAGRYTLKEAASWLQEHAGEREETMLEKLGRAAFKGGLAMYPPGENARLDYMKDGGSNNNGDFWHKNVRPYYEEAFWNDLNTWLDNNEPRVTARFPAPTDTEGQSIEVAKKEESATERKQRLIARVNGERAKGIKGFNKKVAEEEGISVSRLKQIIGSDGSSTPASSTSNSWAGLRGGRS